MEKRVQRYIPFREVTTRSEGEERTIEGYFAVYGDVYELWPGATESIAPGAFSESISGDVRALYNHNDDIVLGRTGAGTLELRDDSHGLWGKITINSNDSDAMNAVARIDRGDVSGASFGFNIEAEETDYREDGSVHWTITRVNPLYEVSPCAFPAYEATSIHARKDEYETIRKRQLDAWKNEMKGRLRNAQGSPAEKAD